MPCCVCTRQEGAVDGGIAHGAERCASARSEKNVTFSQICVTYVCRSSVRLALVWALGGGRGGVRLACGVPVLGTAKPKAISGIRILLKDKAEGKSVTVCAAIVTRVQWRAEFRVIFTRDGRGPHILRRSARLRSS